MYMCVYALLYACQIHWEPRVTWCALESRKICVSKNHFLIQWLGADDIPAPFCHCQLVSLRYLVFATGLRFWSVAFGGEKVFIQHSITLTRSSDIKLHQNLYVVTRGHHSNLLCTAAHAR